MIDKNKLKLLADTAEKSKKLKELNVQFPDFSLLSQQLAQSLPKIDFSEVMKSFQIKIPEINFAQILPKIDYSHLFPKIDYSQLLRNYQIPLMNINPSLLNDIYIGQFASLQKIASEFTKIHASSLAKIRANAFLTASSIESIKNVEILSESFAVEIALQLQQILENIEKKEANSKDLESFVKNTIEEQSSFANKVAIFTFIIGLLTFLVNTGSFYYAKLQYDEGKQSSQLVDQRHSEIMNVLNQIAVGVNEEFETDKAYYVAQRSLLLKIKPTFKSATIAVIYPNQQVTLIKSSHKWIYVEYFDYLDGIPKYGWANKKYLVRIEKSK
jgi:uncharacterized protein YgiM (DUF1202 family)